MRASDSKYETLKNMNGTTAKHAQWCVRVLDPKLVEYSFTARGETVNATRFECLIVSMDPKQYMQARVPFRFEDRQAPKKAFDRFKDQAVWIIKTAWVVPGGSLCSRWGGCN